MLRTGPDRSPPGPLAAPGAAAAPREAAADGELGLSVAVTERHALVAVHGEIDAATAPRLADCLQALARQRSLTVVVDLHDVSFMDAAALRTFVTARTQLRRQGGNLILVAPNNQARLVLEVTRLDTLLARPASRPRPAPFDGDRACRP